MRIVLAEDEALLREGLVMLLEHAGHDVVASVATATELVHVVKRGDPTARPDVRPDMVITDVRMPPGRTDDGLRAAIELRRDRPHLPDPGVELCQPVPEAGEAYGVGFGH